MSTINERIQEIIDKMFSGNKRSFSAKVGIAATVTENIVGKRQSNPSYDVTLKIVSSLEYIDSEWLLKGKGQMLKADMLQKSDEKDIVAEDQFLYKKLPLYTLRPFIDSTLGINESFESAIDSQDCKELIITSFNDYDFSLRNYGESMMDKENPKKSINDLDIVVCKFWKDKSYIRWGEIYALATTNGCIIKKIIPADDAEKIRCISLNEENGYNAYDMPLSEILDIAIVVGAVSIKVL